MSITTLTPAVRGRFSSTYTWAARTSGSDIYVTTGSSRGYAGFAVPLDDASQLTSARLLTVLTSGVTLQLLGMSAPATTTPTNSNPYSGAGALGPNFGDMPSNGSVDVTAYVASMLGHAQWNQNTKHVGFITSPNSNPFSAVTYEWTLELTVVVPASTGTATRTYLLGSSATGVRPIVPPSQGHGALGYLLGWAADGLRPPTGNQGGSDLGYRLGHVATGRRTSSGKAAASLRLGPTATGRRDAKGSSGLSYRLGLEAVSTAPPPTPSPPWRDAIHTAAYRDAIAARTVTIDARVDILDPSGAVIARLGGPDATHGGIVGGTVSVLESRDAWWDCDLSIDQAELTPTEVGDLLHPLSHNRLKVWWRILVAPGRWVELPVGTYYADWPSVSYDGGVSVSMQVRGQDVSWLIARAEMQGSVSVGGATVDEAIRAVLTASASWAPLALTATGRRLPAGYEAGEPGANPWQVARRLASSVGMELRVTREGTIELGPSPSPSAPPVAAFVEGPGCAAIAASASVPIGSIANRYRVDVNPGVDPDGNEVEPFSATATDDDPTSPLWIGHGYYYDKSTSTDAVTTVEQARKMAEGLLRASQALSETGELVIFPAPHLEVGDVIDVSIPSVAMMGARQVRGWSLALGDLGGMRVPVSGRRRW